MVAWLGSLSYPANLHGLTEFLEQGWAPMGDAGYRMRVIGQGLSLANQSVMVNRFPGIEFTGFVENLGDALADVHVAVAPLWSGAGVKMKTLTLMGFGIPVYGTSVAFEGIDVADLGVVFDDPIELSQKVLNSSDKSLEDIGIEMKNRVHRDHSHTALAKAVADSMNKLAELV
ncbi:glycosyltransferase family 4 protein [Rhodococcus sp. ANT_H53B]|uniref:glycosyltransferase family 4 protein n=1 Tax=Rhodococcus sp. ANT_H53B TaxID=2597357 RepID=UPI00165E4882|nr:glycosyltransferase family 4 protein [Rhodococcus sp. ANT_H53B]